MLKYFRKGLRPSILAKLQNKNLELESFVQIIKKAVIAKAKANLWPWATTCDIDQQCTQGFRSTNTTADKASSWSNSQSQSINDPCVEEPKAQSPKSLIVL